MRRWIYYNKYNIINNNKEEKLSLEWINIIIILDNKKKGRRRRRSGDSTAIRRTTMEKKEGEEATTIVIGACFPWCITLACKPSL